MPQCSIKVQLKTDPPATIDNLKVPYVRGELDTMVILEGGMQSGKTSVALHIITASGESVIVETSAAILEGIAATLKGAEMRFSDIREKKN